MKGEKTSVNADEKAYIDPILVAEGFGDGVLLNEGQNGMIWLFNYQGNDPEVKILCNETGQILVKQYRFDTLSEQSDIDDSLPEARQEALERETESTISSYLYERKNETVDVMAPIRLQKKQREELSEFENMEPHYVLAKKMLIQENIFLMVKPVLHKDNKSRTLEHHLLSLCFQMKDKMELSDEEKLIPLQIAQEMLKILRDVHTRGVIHGDFRLCNIFISRDEEFYLGDFGNACMVGGGSIHELVKAPILFYDEMTIQTRYRTLLTDIFAYKATLMASIAMLAGAANEDSALFSSKNLIVEQQLRQRENYNNGNALVRYFNQMSAHIDNMSDSAWKNLLIQFKESFEDYLTSMPSINRPLIDAEQEELNRALRTSSITSVEENERLFQMLMLERIVERIGRVKDLERFEQAVDVFKELSAKTPMPGPL